MKVRRLINFPIEELKVFVEGISVYARVLRNIKSVLIRAWQEKGNIVSMTGDGVKRCAGAETGGYWCCNGNHRK